MNYYSIGDVHGQFFKLNQLVKRLNIKKDDILVFLGDYIDRGDMSFEVIDLLIALSKAFNCVFIRGNHEYMFMDYLSGINEDLFIYNGGRKTIDSYKKHGYDVHQHTDYRDRHMPRSHIEFFQKLVKFYETEDFIFVHAGIHPSMGKLEIPLERLPDEILLWDRGFNYAKYNGPKVVVYGHTPNNRILNEKYKICIDTGACFDSMGDLTAVKLPERTFIRQGWTIGDLDGRDDNGKASKKDGEGIFTFGENISKPGSGGWST